MEIHPLLPSHLKGTKTHAIRWTSAIVRVRVSLHTCPNEADYPKKWTLACLNWSKQLRCEMPLVRGKGETVWYRLILMLQAFIIKRWHWGTDPRRPYCSLITDLQPLSTSSQKAAMLDNNLLSRTWKRAAFWKETKSKVRSIFVLKKTISSIWHISFTVL